MGELILILAKYTVFLLAVFFVLWLVHKPVKWMRYKKDCRYLHCRNIAISVLLMIGVGNGIVFPYILQGMNRVIQNPYVASVINAVTPQRNFRLVFMIILILLLNLGYLALSSIAFLLIRILFHGDRFINLETMDLPLRILHFPWIPANLLYRRNEDNGKNYELTEGGSVNYFWAKRMKSAFLLLGVIEIIFLSVVCFMQNDELVQSVQLISMGWYMLPTAGFILVEQITFFLEHTHYEKSPTVESEQIVTTFDQPLEPLVKWYEQQFQGSNALINQYTYHNDNKDKKGIAHNGVSNTQLKDCKEPYVLEILSNQITGAGVKQNSNYQNALISLLNGESISVRDLIQGNFLIYYCAYINYYMSQGSTFLILCENRDEVEKVIEAISDRMKMLNKVCSVWKISDKEEAASNGEVNLLVCSLQELISSDLFEKREIFFQNLRTVMIDKAAAFCAQGNIQKNIIFSELRRITKEHQFIFMTEIESPVLLADYRQYIHQSISSFKEEPEVEDAYVMVWAEESFYKIQRVLGIGTELSDYLGVALPLALLPVKVDFPYVHIYTSGRKPIKTYQKALTTNQQVIMKYLQSRTNLSQTIRINDFSELCVKKNVDVMILYDDHFNLYNTLWNWLKYSGTKKSLIHIVSPQYLLRDYFADNMEHLVQNDGDYSPLISGGSELNRSRFQSLVLEIANAGMSDAAIMSKSREYGWKYRNIRELLYAALQELLNGKREPNDVVEHFRFQEMEDDDVQNKDNMSIMVYLNDSNIGTELTSQTEFAKMDGKEIPILKENLYNYYLKEQKISVNGTVHNVLNIENGQLDTEEVHVDTREQYYQVSEFIFHKSKMFDQCVDLEIIDFNKYITEVSRSIHGYWSTDKDIDFSENSTMKLRKIRSRHDSGGTKSIPITQRKDNIQVLEILIAKKALGADTKGAVRLLSFMFQEMFKTLFPDTYMNLFALTDHEPEEGYWDKMFDPEQEKSENEKIQSIMPFTRKKIPNTIKKKPEDFEVLYVVEFSSVELGMITSLYENRRKVFQIVKTYLKWYLNKEQNAENAAKKGYLNLGMDTIPQYFAAEDLYKFCEKLIPEKHEVPKEKTTVIEAGPEHTCSFCGKVSFFPNTISDGRKMCKECSEQVVSQEAEIKGILSDVLFNMRRHYNISLRDADKIDIGFKSAETLRKMSKINTENARVLGVYDYSNKTLWVERGGPKNSVMSTLFHEMTHVWQREQDIEKLLSKTVRKAKDRTLWLEGQACYIEVDAMKKIGQVEYSDIYAKQLKTRNDEYGEGYKLMEEKFRNSDSAASNNPFIIMKELVQKGG